jgi:DHA2 family multidrug resistance protein
LIAVAMWRSTALIPDVDFGFFAWMRVFQMIGLPFLFVPISTASYAALRPEETNQASALINVARNLGGSIGVSLTNALVADRSQFHQSRLVEHFFPSSLTYQNALDRAIGQAISQGTTQADAEHRAIASLSQLVQEQSTLLAYIDVFWACAIFALAMIPVAFMLRDVTSSAPSEGIEA